MATSTWREALQQRITITALVFSIGFILLTLRLWQVQVLQETEHRNSVNRQSIRPVRLNPVRGRIFASGQRPLVDNHSTYDLIAYVSFMRQPGRLSHTLEYILKNEQEIMKAIGRQPALTEEMLRKHIWLRPVMPLTLAENLTENELARFLEYVPQIPGMELQSRIKRQHVIPGLASHLIGFTTWQTPDGTDILEDLPRIYVSPQLVGKSGLEQAFNDILTGTPGSRLVRVDSIGYTREYLGEENPPVNGSDLYLTLDVEAQTAAEKVLEGYSGALVAINVNTGAIMAMASAPTFDLTTLTPQRLAELNRDTQNTPMLNRATRGIYMPGSIVKPLIAMAALESGNVSPDEIYTCTGSFTTGGHTIRCANRYGHGNADIIRAIAVSCNPFFLNIGMRCGLDILESAYRAAGFGSKTGFELGELAGYCPSQETARRFWKRNWLPIDTAFASMGQGGIAVTPLQAAVYTAAIANGGIVYRPHVIDEIRLPNGTVQQKIEPEIRNRLPFSDESIEIARRAMRRAVTSSEGGAKALAKVGLDLAGKTGTAEVGSGEKRHKNTWAIAFGPYDNPQYAVACIIENGASGTRTAIPVVAEFFSLWLKAN